MNIKLRDFESQIMFFNGMYRLPVAPYPSFGKVVEDRDLTMNGVRATDREAIMDRLAKFKRIILKEVEEVDIIIARLDLEPNDINGAKELEILTDLADWLGDIQVYCASEMVKFGIPVKETLDIIMSSNFSKLGADGEPIYDNDGKVQKGPGYWKPEPQLKAMLQERIDEAMQKKTTGIIWRE